MPQLEYWFEQMADQLFFGSALLVSRVMGRRIAVSVQIIWGLFLLQLYGSSSQWWIVGSVQRHSKKQDPLWKVHVLVNHLNKQVKGMRLPGKWLAID